jgi:hypothetical protein
MAGLQCGAALQLIFPVETEPPGFARTIKSIPQGLKAESFRFVVYGLKPVPTSFHRGSHTEP